MQIVFFNGVGIETVDQAARFTESLISTHGLTGRKAKRCFAIAIELIQNILIYSKGDEKATLNINARDNLPIEIISVNYTDQRNRNRFEKKIKQLKVESDLRLNFQKKLLVKMESDSFKSGDFGLDLCLRYSRDCVFKIVPANNELEIIHLQLLID